MVYRWYEQLHHRMIGVNVPTRSKLDCYVMSVCCQLMVISEGWIGRSYRPTGIQAFFFKPDVG
jgi:hypothetical protein